MKAARVRLETQLLARALGLPFPWEIVHAQVLHAHWERLELELVITGESLEDGFTVQEGWPIREGQIEVTFEQRTATIVPLVSPRDATHERS